jgi:hypothetical protein
MNKTSHSHKSSCGCSACQSTVLCRPRYFPRQLITPEELNLEADYFRDAFRRLRRLLWGWGVVCGAVVCRAPKCQEPGETSPPECEPWKVMIKPGYVLGPCGDEIIIPCEAIVDLRSPGTNDGSCHEPCDPWCTGSSEEPRERTLCVAVKYQQVMSRPVRTQSCGCGCDDSSCEYSRWCDGYEIGVLPECPECEEKEPIREEGLRGILPETALDCPECPDSPWVCLARIKVDECGRIIEISNCPCRRLVPTLRNLWSKCHAEPCMGEAPKRNDPEQKLEEKTVAAATATKAPGKAAAKVRTMNR